ncbi:MAG: hypothetical protein ACYTGL_09940 [Planctomycetota bacterium]|jgi:hypothetical protein
MASNYRYSALATVSKVYRFFGWLFLIGAVLTVIGSVVVAIMMGGGFGIESIMQIGMGLLTAVGLIWAAITTWAIAEGIKLAMDVEDHARQVRDYLRQDRQA